MTGRLASFGTLYHTREEWEAWAKGVLSKWHSVGYQRVRGSAVLHGYEELAEELIHIDLAERML